MFSFPQLARDSNLINVNQPALNCVRVCLCVDKRMFDDHKMFLCANRSVKHRRSCSHTQEKPFSLRLTNVDGNN